MAWELIISTVPGWKVSQIIHSKALIEEGKKYFTTEFKILKKIMHFKQFK